MDNNNIEQEELTQEQEAAQYEADRDKAFFEGAEDGEGIENSETEENEEADQGHQDPEGEPDGGDAGATDQGENETGEDDGQGDEDPASDTEPNEGSEGEPVEQKVFKLKWNGEDIEVSEGEMIALGQKGFDYTAKMQNISKYRKGLEAAGIDDSIIDLMSRVKQGDKTALVELAQKNSIDVYDLIGVEPSENNPTALQKTGDEIVVSEQVMPLMERVMSDPSLQAQMERAEEYLPTAVINSMAQDPDLFYAAIDEVSSGSFDQVMPRVQMRLAAMSDLDRDYATSSSEVFGNIYIEEKRRLMQGTGQSVEQGEPQPKAPKPKPNMAEVGIKKTPSSVNREKVIVDAFSSDDEYEKILQRVRSNS